MPMSFIMSKNVEHSSEKTPRELMEGFTNFYSFLWSSSDIFHFLRTALLLRLDSKPTVNFITYRHVDWIKKKKIWMIIPTSYYWGIQKTIKIGIEWRVNINYWLKWLGNEVKDGVLPPGKAIKVLLTTSDNMKKWFRINAKGALIIIIIIIIIIMITIIIVIIIIIIIIFKEGAQIVLKW